MKQTLHKIVQTAIDTLIKEKTISNDISVPIKIDHARDKQFGDYATNIALVLGKQVKQNPKALAELIIKALPKSDVIEKTEIAGPGFINFFISDSAFHAEIKSILEQKEKYGHSSVGKEDRIHIEFVSANPTGPLHVGHGRGAAYGSPPAI